MSVTTDDSGSYVCTATNIWGTTTSSLQLGVYSSLKFVNKPPSSVVVKVNETLNYLIPYRVIYSQQFSGCSIESPHYLKAQLFKHRIT